MSEPRSRAERIWYDESMAGRAVRGVLAPLSWLFAAGVGLRDAAYRRGTFRTVVLPIPTISVGNISVGGTGKTPFTAFLAAQLLGMGRRPAIVLRGYGGDEALLHEELTPQATVVTDADRVRGVRTAARRGADVAVLDDAFQHRRARRDVDIVLVSADQWDQRHRVLPAGPLREPLSALRRASLVVITAKAAPPDRIAAARAGVSPYVGDAVAVARFRLAALHCAGRSESRSIRDLRGVRVLAVSAVGDPDSFHAQLASVGALVTPLTFADHHRYTADDAARIAAVADGHNYVICTGKDVVKLRPLWAFTGVPLWYVSQAVEVSDGMSLIAAALRDALSR